MELSEASKQKIAGLVDALFDEVYKDVYAKAAPIKPTVANIAANEHYAIVQLIDQLIELYKMRIELWMTTLTKDGN